MRVYRRLKSIGCNENNEENKEQPRFTRNHRIRYEQTIPQQFANSLVPLNAFEQKDRFLRRKLTPEFHLNISTSDLESALLNSSGNITFTLFREATRILNIVCRRFKSIDNFIEESFGPRISIEDATNKITDYIKESNLPTSLDVIWCDDLVGSALMCSTGMDRNGNIPRHRKFTMLLKTNEENTYLRENGIINLMDHEIGTHYHRSFNEGLQPWYGKRDIYGLGSTNTNEAVKTEEGLACIHTVLRAKYRYLGIPALLYYGSCMAEYLPFKDLFEHLGRYVANEEQRWKHCMRIKRCLPSQDLCGGYGKDQRYFEGAVAILRQQANIDFSLLMAGKLALSELERVRRCVIMAAVRFPTFMMNRPKYMATLRQIARLNGIPMVKRTLEKTRSRSQVLPVEHRPSSSGVLVCSSVSFNGPQTSNQVPSQHSGRSSSESDGQTHQTLEHNRPRSCNDQAQALFTQPEPDLNGPAPNLEKQIQGTSKRLNTPGRESERARTHSGISFEAGVSGPDSSQQDINHKAIRKQIVLSLARLNLPNNHLSNSILCRRISHKETTGTDRNFPKASRKEQYESDSVTLENGIRTLPHGVCGCRLFTHGSLKQPDKDIHGTLRTRTRSTSSLGEPMGLFKAAIPVVLEIDMRHPLVGV